MLEGVGDSSALLPQHLCPFLLCTSRTPLRSVKTVQKLKVTLEEVGPCLTAKKEEQVLRRSCKRASGCNSGDARLLPVERSSVVTGEARERKEVDRGGVLDSS